MKEEQTIQAQLLQLYVKFIIFIVAARLSILQLNWWTSRNSSHATQTIWNYTHNHLMSQHMIARRTEKYKLTYLSQGRWRKLQSTSMTNIINTYMKRLFHNQKCCLYIKKANFHHPLKYSSLEGLPPVRTKS